MAVHALSTPPSPAAKPSRRRLLTAGAALAAVGVAPAVSARTAAAPAPNPDAELIRLADLAVATCRLHLASLSDEVRIPPEVEAENERLSALQDDYCLRAARLTAHTPAGRCAKAKTVALLNSYNLSATGDPAAYALESLLDDAMGGVGSVEVFFDDVFGRGRVA